MANAAERAEYRYYAHGPLKRVELGDDLQGMDHAYTIQGWLKAINSPDEQWRDPGKDGVAGTTNAAFAPDLFGMALDYFNGDYTRSGTGITSHIGSEVAGLAPDNFNGLVRAQRWNNRALATGLYNFQGQALSYSYNYDALGQLTKAQLSTVHGTAQGAAPLAAYVTVKEDYKTWGLSYDLNGNLLTLNRHGQTPQGLAMDQLSYHYTEDAQGNKTHNRLAQVANAVSSFNYPNTGLPPNQGTDNYTYNELGQLVGDTKDGRYFSYYAHGRVKTVYSDPARTFKLAHFT
ncbi:MAG: hypothetical protein KDC00_11275, partial [Flavobacteriales bacterium]|nr:hypothetical protein [Flavobacteriales bacterium]